MLTDRMDLPVLQWRHVSDGRAGWYRHLYHAYDHLLYGLEYVPPLIGGGNQAGSWRRSRTDR